MSGNLGFSQVNLERVRKFREFQNFPKIVYIGLQSSEKYNFYKLKIIYGQKHYFHHNLGLGCWCIS